MADSSGRHRTTAKHAAQPPPLQVEYGFLWGLLLGLLTVAALVLIEPWAGPTR